MCPESSRKNRESVITFNDLYDAAESMAPLPQGYGGFTWSPSAWFLTHEQMPSLRASGRVVLFNAQGKHLCFESEKPFGLKDVLLSALWDGRCDVSSRDGEKEGRGTSHR